MVTRTPHGVLTRSAIRVSAILLGIAGLGAVAFGVMVALIAEGRGAGFDLEMLAWIVPPSALGVLGIVSGVMVWRRSAAWRLVGMTLALLGVYLGISWAVSEGNEPILSLLLLVPPSFVLVALGVSASHFHRHAGSDRPAYAGPARGAPAIPGAVA